MASQAAWSTRLVTLAGCRQGSGPVLGLLSALGLPGLGTGACRLRGVWDHVDVGLQAASYHGVGEGSSQLLSDTYFEQISKKQEAAVSLSPLYSVLGAGHPSSWLSLAGLGENHPLPAPPSPLCPRPHVP